MQTYTILLLAGDGIGPEIMAEAKKVIAWINSTGTIRIETTEGLLGGCAYDVSGSPFPPETLAAAQAADAILLGAVGGPKWANAPFDKRPEQGLLDIRKELDLFANLRPAKVFPALADASSLKADIVKGLDVLIVRELVGGIYFGQPRGIEELPDGKKRGFNTTSYSTDEVNRIAKVSFDVARLRGKRVCSIDKANVLESSIVWRQAATELAASAYPDIQLTHMYVDNAAMQLATKPSQFDVLLTPNLAGDILSDLAAALTGSLGMLPSASLGLARPDGATPGLYEPVHGSAPDIAGQGIANPLAMILSLGMLLAYSLKQPQLAAQIEDAVSATLAAGYRTADIATAGAKVCSTSEMGDQIVQHLRHAQAA